MSTNNNGNGDGNKREIIIGVSIDVIAGLITSVINIVIRNWSVSIMIVKTISNIILLYLTIKMVHLLGHYYRVLYTWMGLFLFGIIVEYVPFDYFFNSITDMKRENVSETEQLTEMLITESEIETEPIFVVKIDGLSNRDISKSSSMQIDRQKKCRLLDNEIAMLFFGMPQGGWSSGEQVYPVLCSRFDELFSVQAEEVFPAGDSQDEKEILYITKNGDDLREKIENIREMEKDDFQGTVSWYMTLPSGEQLFDLIYVREELVKKYPRVDLHRLISYDYQMLGDEYYNQQGYGDTILFFYGKSVFELEEAMKFSKITKKGMEGKNIILSIEAVYTNIQNCNLVGEEYRKSASAIVEAIGFYRESQIVK